MSNDEMKIRTGCAKDFARMGSAVEGFTKAVDGFRTQGFEFQQRITTVEASTKTALDELKNDVVPDLKAIPGQVRTALIDHKSDCPAYIREMEKVKRGRSVAPYSGSKTEDFFGLKFSTMKTILYFCLAVGGIIAGVGVTLGYWAINV